MTETRYLWFVPWRDRHVTYVHGVDGVMETLLAAMGLGVTTCHL